MSYDKCFNNCPEFRVLESPAFGPLGEPDGVDIEPACAIYPDCIYKRMSVRCRNRSKICEGHGLPCHTLKCTGFDVIRRVWNKESIMSHFGITEEEFYYRDPPTAG